MIRNILFSFFFFLGIILICVIYIPALVLPKFVVLSGGKMMGYWSAICLRIFLSTKIIIKGKENVLIIVDEVHIACGKKMSINNLMRELEYKDPEYLMQKNNK